jgi:hypothetical protein
MMTKECFEQLLQQHQASGMGIKKFLQERGICYSNYQYWKHKFSQSSESEPESGILTPVNVSPTATPASPAPTDGINMLFPNGVRVFCAANMEEAAIRLINQYTGSHVLPE